MTRLVVGLGNPGPDHLGTRHNVGFEVVERLARTEGTLFRTANRLEGYQGRRDFSWARLAHQDALLVRPEGFMNRSGEMVLALARFLGGGELLDPGRLLVVYDDLDLEVGVVRIRPHGGAGGHNGMRSIIERTGTDRFPRVRVGIGRPRTDAARHVLERFAPAEREEIDISVAEAAEAVADWLATGDLEGCMTRFHSRWNQASPGSHEPKGRNPS